jgi:hypothetical protein
MINDRMEHWWNYNWQEQSFPSATFLSQISHGMLWDRTWAYAVITRQLWRQSKSRTLYSKPKIMVASVTGHLFAQWGVESKLGPLGTSAIYWPIVPAPGDCEDGECGGRNGRGNRSTRRKPAPTPLCLPQIPLDQTRDWTRTAAVGSQRLTASAMERATFSPC